MKYCDKCKVDVRGKVSLCPLCQNKLSGMEEEEIYPVLPTMYKQFELFFKLLILCTVAAGLSCVAINLIMPNTGYWSLFVVLGIICFWIGLAFAIRKRNNIPRNIVNQVVIVSVLCIGWDVITGWRGWSLDFVIPITCVVALISLAVVAKVTKMPVGDYMVYLFANIAFGIIPIIFYLTGWLRNIIPSVICVAFSILSMVALMLFEGRNLRLELIKRFHL